MTSVQAADDDQATELLATRVPEHLPADGETLPPGAQLGHYLVQALLGRGGMGEVYRAEQLHPVRRTVALKLLRSQRLQARHLAYFEVERQLLAQMQHPAIAHIYDAGTTAEGYPFFAMEYLEGSPLTHFADEAGLDLRQRIALFIRICEGVQHAHHKGVIHRDLKPGNILVTKIDGRPLPRIIDFGIATATSRALGSESGERAGTPEYMSPEQASGDASLVDTRSDVYSLGVLLYELISRVRPAPVGQTQAPESITLMAPSRQIELSQAQAGSDAPLRQVGKRRRAEVDAIVLKAMQFQRADRYGSAAELAQDLQRFLDGQPVRAMPATRGYLWTRFIARHRTGFAAASLISLALVLGLGLSIYGLVQARQQSALAEQRSQALEKVVGFQQSMLESVDIETMGLGMAEGLRKQVAAADPKHAAAFEASLGRVSTADLARQLVDQNLLTGAEAAIAQDFAKQPVLAADLRESMARVQRALGMTDKAEKNFRQVAEFRNTRLGPTDVGTLRAREGQINALMELAKPDQAQALLTPTLANASKLPLNQPVRAGLEQAQVQLLNAQGKRDQAKQQARTLYQQLKQLAGDRDPATMDALGEWADQQRGTGDLKEARANMEQLLKTRQAVQGARHPDTLASASNLAILRVLTGEKVAAVTLQRELVQTQTQRLGSEHPLTLHARTTLASMLVDSGEAEQAVPMMLSVLDAQTRVLGAMHPRTIRTRLNLASAYARLDDYTKALPLEEEVIRARTELLGERHPDTLSILINHAGTQLRAGQTDQTLRGLSDVLPLARQVLGDKHSQTQLAMLIRAEALMAKGEGEAAIAMYRQLFEVRRKLLGEDDTETIVGAWNLVEAYEKLGQKDAAAALRWQYMEPLLAAKPESLSESQRDLAQAMRDDLRPGRL